MLELRDPPWALAGADAHQGGKVQAEGPEPYDNRGFVLAKHGYEPTLLFQA